MRRDRPSYLTTKRFTQAGDFMFPYLDAFGLHIRMYYVMYAVGVVGAVLLALLTRRLYGATRLKAALYTVTTFVCGFLGAQLMARIYNFSMQGAVSQGESKFAIFGGVVFLPVFFLAIALLSREKYRVVADMMTPGFLFFLAAGKFGCFLEGCCYGVPSEHGVWSAVRGARCFPVQLWESICTLVVVAVVLTLAFKGGNRLKCGALYPIGVMLYCGTRFVWEFFRFYDSKDGDFFLGMTYWQLWCIVAVVCAAVWLIVLYRNPAYADCDLTTKR